MSNTDKDRPRWVRDNDPTTGPAPVHLHHAGHPCDLDDVAADRDAGRDRTCHRVSAREIFYGGGPPRDYVHAVWWGPQRTRERDACRELTKQHRATGDVDDHTEPAPDQHRHGAAWDWW